MRTDMSAAVKNGLSDKRRNMRVKEQSGFVNLSNAL